ncbi:hypothetical protein [Mycolicibacterium hippocampi]|uniref:DUF7162 family protein n=1 Tax=Mycolicibacterium hippocampi TaxID=659824 RepID=UPI003515B7A1
MGEIASVDADRLRRLADTVSAAAAEIAEAPWPELEPDELRGSAVSERVRPGPVGEQVREGAEQLREWASAARTSAATFECADAVNGDRFASG